MRLDDYARQQVSDQWVEVAPEILRMPLWSPELCARLVEAAEANGDFKPYLDDVKNDAAPGQEIRLNLISKELVEMFYVTIMNVVYPVARSFWWPVVLGEPRMPFVIRCSPGTQPNLTYHHDSCLVSMSVRLNSEYEGGSLHFPRQRWSNDQCRVGEAVLFPGGVTHVHGIRPVTAGSRYGLTCWFPSKGYKSDLMKVAVGG